MKTLTEIVKEKDSLKDQLAKANEAHKIFTFKTTSEIKELERLEGMEIDGMDLGKVAIAEELIYISGQADNMVDGRKLTESACIDIINGCSHLKTQFYGNKRYDGFYQATDCNYGYGPRHGSIVDEIGLTKEGKGKDFSPEEIEACVYYIKNYSKVKKAKENITERSLR